MKKILSGAVLAGLLFSPAMILAVVEQLPPGQTGAIPIVSTGAELLGLITKIGDWVFIFLVAVAAIFLIVSGFMYITAAGSTENITKAKQMLINALIGVVIALLARGMVQVIRSILGG